MAIGFRRDTLIRCEYENLMRLAKVLGLDTGEYPSKGWLADHCAQEMIRQGGPKPPVQESRIPIQPPVPSEHKMVRRWTVQVAPDTVDVGDDKPE